MMFLTENGRKKRMLNEYVLLSSEIDDHKDRQTDGERESERDRLIE